MIYVIHQWTLSISEPETRFAPILYQIPNVYKTGGINVSRLDIWQDMLRGCFLYKIWLFSRICVTDRFILDLALQYLDCWTSTHCMNNFS
jgi:hypothetical protein